MEITYYGQSCFAAVVAGKTLLFDPFIRKNQLAQHVDVEAIQPDYVLVTHGHFDHIDDAADIAKRTGATVIANAEVATWLKEQGAASIHPMNHGGGFNFLSGASSSSTPSTAAACPTARPAATPAASWSKARTATSTTAATPP